MTPNAFSEGPTPVPGTLQAIRKEWETIYAESALRSPFLTFEFLCLWYNSFAAEDEIRIIRVESEGEIVGVLPMQLCLQAGRRVLKSITNHHCLHCSPLIRKNRETQFSDRLYPTFHEDGSSWDVLRLGPFFSFNPEVQSVSEPILSASGFRAGRTVQPNYTINLQMTFEEYYQHVISSKLRTNLKRRRRRLHETGDGTFHHYQQDEAVAHFDDFLQLEHSGWKGREGSSILSLPENYQRYYRHLVRYLARRNELHLFFLALDGRPIAGAFGYTEGEVFHWFKIGYREEFRDLGPSNLLLLDIINFLMENRRDIKRFHLFPGFGVDKHRWINEDATTIEAFLFSNSMRGRYSYAAYLARERLRTVPWLRRLVKRFRSDEKGFLFWSASRSR